MPALLSRRMLALIPLVAILVAQPAYAAGPPTAPAPLAPATAPAPANPSPAAPASAPTSVPAAVPAASAPLAAPAAPVQWAITTDPAPMRSGPSEDSVQFGVAKPLTLVQVLRYQGDWAYVRDPRGGGEAYVPSGLLGPTDPPSPYLTKAAPKLTEPLDERGVVTAEGALSVYPTDAQEAVDQTIEPGTWLSLDGIVRGEDGSDWYRTTDGDYVPESNVFVSDMTENYVGRWLDVDLNSPTTVTAYENGEPVRSFLAIRGAGARPTPTGTFTILRRVANETMDSSTIGIPRNGPGGYYLTGVLWTQYFTGDGASFHYNYWSSMWGYPGSHGCLGLTYGDSSWLWDWASIGTPTSIHY